MAVDILPLSSSDLARWRTRMDRAQRESDTYKKSWENNLDAYRMKGLPIAPLADTAQVPKDFANVNQKIAQLFFETPEVHITPDAQLLAGKEDAALMFQSVLNKKLGPKGADVKRTFEKMLFDVLCPAGMGCSKIGYTNVVAGMIPAPMGPPAPVMDPMTGQPQVDPRTGQPVMQPTMVEVPNIKREEWFWTRFSPLKLLVPHDFRDNDFDKAPWLGMKGTKPLRVAKRDWNLPPDFKSTVDIDKHVLNPDPESRGDATEDLVEYVEIWYQTALYDDEVLDPLRYRVLVLVDGLDDGPVEHRDSPYQKLEEDGFVNERVSMIGNPIHILQIRDLADSAYQPSDCQITRTLVQEVNTFRTQLLRVRDANRPLRIYDDQMDPATVEKMANGETGSYIPVANYDPARPPVMEVTKATPLRENYTSQQIIEGDINEAWAMGPSQRGMPEQSDATATEIQTRTNSASVRLEKERAAVIACFTKGVESKFAPLLVQFFDPTDAVELLGQDGTQRWMQWDKDAISVRWGVTAKPDSGVYLDADTERRVAMNGYNFLRKDPRVEPDALLTWTMRKMGMNPQQMLAPPAPPPGPPPPNVNVRVLMEDLIGPAAPIALKILQSAGYELTDQDLAVVQQSAAALMAQQGTLYPPRPPTAPPPGQPGQPQAHGGMSDQTDLLNKHAAEETGGMPGMPAQGQMVQ